MHDSYVRKAKLVRVVDGDTLYLDVDVGFSLTIRQCVRVLGVNCPEMKGETKAAGEAAKLFVMGWFEKRGPDVVVKTHKDKNDSFGRFLAEVVFGMDSLGVDLLASGHAVPFRG